jgi:UDP-glucose 4-epimerase
VRVVVTGATGHLGRVAVARLARAGHDVVAVSRSGAVPVPPFGEPAAPGVQALAIDLGEETAVAALGAGVERADALVHLAAWHPPATASTDAHDRRKLIDVNVLGTMRTLDAAREMGARVVVYASSFEVYGDVSTVPVTETERVQPLSDYGVTKLAGEDHLISFGYEEGIRVVALRFPAIYGPGEATSRALPNFLKAVARGEAPTIFGDGGDLRDQVHARDAARAIELALVGGAAGIFNIADGKPHSVADLARAALAAAGLELDVKRLPREKQRRDYHLSIDKARLELGFEPEVELARGMAQQLAWLRAEGARANGPGVR